MLSRFEAIVEDVFAFITDYRKRSITMIAFVSFLKGLLIALNSLFAFLGVTFIPLGDALTIIYASTLFTMIFSFVCLGIKQGPWKITFALILMIGIILVIRPPILFPHDGSVCHETVQVFEAEKPENYTLGVLFSFSCSASLGLTSVCVAYIKVRKYDTILFHLCSAQLKPIFIPILRLLGLYSNKD